MSIDLLTLHYQDEYAHAWRLWRAALAAEKAAPELAHDRWHRRDKGLAYAGVRDGLRHFKRVYVCACGGSHAYVEPACIDCGADCETALADVAALCGANI